MASTAIYARNETWVPNYFERDQSWVNEQSLTASRVEITQKLSLYLRSNLQLKKLTCSMPSNDSTRGKIFTTNYVGIFRKRLIMSRWTCQMNFQLQPSLPYQTSGLNNFLTLKTEQEHSLVNNYKLNQNDRKRPITILWTKNFSPRTNSLI